MVGPFRKLCNAAYLKLAARSSAGINLDMPLMDRRNIGQFLYQQRLFNLISGIQGDVVECGVGHGKSLISWCYLCINENTDRKLWGFDSFEGFPEPSTQDISPRDARKGEWGGVTLPNMLDMLTRAGIEKYWLASHLTLVKGFLEDSLLKYTGDKIALLHLDVDLYASYKTALEMLYDRVVDGGVIAFDEYMGTREHYKFPGAKKAIDEFMQNKHEILSRDQVWGKYYLVKNNR